MLQELKYIFYLYYTILSVHSAKTNVSCTASSSTMTIPNSISRQATSFFTFLFQVFRKTVCKVAMSTMHVVIDINTSNTLLCDWGVLLALCYQYRENISSLFSWNFETKCLNGYWRLIGDSLYEYRRLIDDSLYESDDSLTTHCMCTDDSLYVYWRFQ